MKFLIFSFFTVFSFLSFAEQTEADKAALAKMQSENAAVIANFPGGAAGLEAAKKSTADAEKRASQPKTKKVDQSYTSQGETIFYAACALSHEAVANAHKCGQVSASVIMDCKCGNPIHTWVYVSPTQKNMSPEQSKRYSALNARGTALLQARLNTVKTAAQNYK